MLTESSVNVDFWLLLSVLLSMLSKKRLKLLLRWLEELLGAEGGTRTPMPFRAQRPERCVSTDFTTSARPSLRTGLYYCIFCGLSILLGPLSVSLCTCYN